MPTVRCVVGIGCIEYIVVQSFVHGPVESQSCFTSIQDAVGVTFPFLIRKQFAPYANLGEVTLEALFGSDVLGTADGERSQMLLLGGCQRLGLTVVHLELKVAAISGNC